MREGRDKNYKYQSAWMRYAYPDEQVRFLSSEEDDLLKICDCIDMSSGRPCGRSDGGIPIHYENDKLYTLKSGPHTRVQGETGSGKSRTICRGAAISAMLSDQSIVLTDPKGEIFEDPKIQYLLQERNYDVHALDFRRFDKDGFNVFSYIVEMTKLGKHDQASDAINRFAGMLVNSKKADDDFWNDQAGDMIKAVLSFTLQALREKEELEKFHLATMQRYISQDHDKMRRMTNALLEEHSFMTLFDHPVYDPLQTYADILANPDRTYACIVSSANALLSAFCGSEKLMRMLSVNSFQIQDFYRKPSALFLIVPDEVSAYDILVGYIIDTMYQVLVSSYSDLYQGKCPASCGIKFICDEIASLKINDMSNKISASRSRQIDWTLIYQSDRQMEHAYPDDFESIRGNCRTHIFLGSSDYEIMKGISDETGVTRLSEGGAAEPVVSVEDLRRIERRMAYKEALVMRGHYIYCAQLPDYDSYKFLRSGRPLKLRNCVEKKRIQIYTIDDLCEDAADGTVKLEYA